MGGSVNQRVMKRARVEKAADKGAGERRSPCPVACCLDLMGDRWTLLVVRDLMMGAERFKEITASPEGIPTNILSDRLGRLLESGVVVQVAAADSTMMMISRSFPLFYRFHVSCWSR